MSRFSGKIIAIFVSSIMIYAMLGSIAFAASIQTRKDTPADFNNLLDSCSTDDLGSLLDILGEERPSRPSEYNSSVRKALVYRAYSKLTYLFRGERDIDYHGIVKWAAKENGVSDQMIMALPTFHLERMIMEKYLGYVWDKLTVTQKQKVIEQVEKERNIAIGKEIIWKAGDMAIELIKEATKKAVTTYGPSTYIVISTFAVTSLNVIANAAGAAVPIGVYLGMNTVLPQLASFVAGPPGWAIMLTSSAITIALPEKDRVSGFVMAIHAIKCAKYGE